MRESDIEAQAKDYLGLRGWWVAPKPAFPRGLPDIVAYRQDRALLIEIKRPGKTWSPAQKRVAERLAAVGTTVWLCHSLEDVAKVESDATGRPSYLKEEP